MKHNEVRRELIKALGLAGILGGSGALSACGAGSAPALAPDEAIAAGLFDTTPANQAATYRHVDRIGPTRLIRRGASARPLPRHPVALDGMRYEHGGLTSTIDDYMRRNRTAGLLILKGGAIALERYGMGNDETSLWTSFSLAKSVTSTLVGAALKDGRIASLDDSVAAYVPQLAGSAYAQNSIRELLCMCSGVAWSEDYAGGASSDITRLIIALGSGQPGAVMALMRDRSRAAAPGTVFNYSTGESYVLACVVAAATGQTLSAYLSQKIWTPAGMEADAYWLLDAERGQEMGGDNISATLRDYGRFGQFILSDGVINGASVLPAGWRELAGRPDRAVTACGNLYPAYPLGYGYQWWSFPEGELALPGHDGAFTAEGIFGQFVYINPKEDVVAVVCSAWPTAWVVAAEIETYTLLANAIAALR